MSLIALTYNNGYPVLIGDILVSSEDLTANISVPVSFTGINNLLPKNQKLYPAGFNQKIYAITDNIAIALAGSVYESTVFLKEIKIFFAYKASTWENTVLFLRNYSWNEEFNTSSLILLHHDYHTFNTYSNGCFTEVTSRFGKVIVGGSGKEQFMEFMKKQVHTINSDHLNPRLEVLLDHLNLFSKFLTIEKDDQETLKDYFGVGYEVIFWSGPDEPKLTKLSNFSHIYVKVLLDEKYQIIGQHPVILYNTKYIDDFLILSVIDFSYATDGYKRFVAAPLDKQFIPLESVPHQYEFSAPITTLSCGCVFADNFEVISSHALQGEIITVNTTSISPGKVQVAVQINPEYLELIREESTRIYYSGFDFT